MDDLKIEIMIGLDDFAHNRIYIMDLETCESTPAKNWGRRNPDSKCYCKILRKLGVRR